MKNNFRAYFQGCLIPGKINQSHASLYIPFQGKEHRLQNYEVLVESSKNNQNLPLNLNIHQMNSQSSNNSTLNVSSLSNPSNNTQLPQNISVCIKSPSTNMDPLTPFNYKIPLNSNFIMQKVHCPAQIVDYENNYELQKTYIKPEIKNKEHFTMINQINNLAKTNKLSVVKNQPKSPGAINVYPTLPSSGKYNY